MKPLTLLLAVGLAAGLTACTNEPEPIVCTEADRNPETELGPDYWPLYGTWRLEDVGVDEHENADGPVSGFMHELTWNPDGTFVVEWEDEVIQVGQISNIVSVNVLESTYFHITVTLGSACPLENPWFIGEYTITATGDSISGEGSMLTTGFSFPWGDSARRKALGYVKI